MKKWLFTASRDGINVDFETVLESAHEPDFWTCYGLADTHGCSLWTVEEVQTP